MACQDLDEDLPVFDDGGICTRRVGATEPIDPMKVRMKMQISSGTPADISGPPPHRSRARWQKLERDRSGPGGEIGSSSALDLIVQSGNRVARRPGRGAAHAAWRGCCEYDS